jgi:DinB superfamily
VLGFRSVPVVVLPGRAPILGFNAAVLSAAIGVAERGEPVSPEALWESFDRVLAGVIAATVQLQTADLDVRLPKRGRTLRELIHDVFYKAEPWAEAGGGPGATHGHGVAPGTAQKKVRQKDEAARYRDPASLVDYGQAVRARLRRRFSPECGAEYGRLIDTPEGRMTTAEAVGWIASHSAHHLRQIYWVMEHTAGILPADPISCDGLPGLSLPDALW